MGFRRLVFAYCSRHVGQVPRDLDIDSLVYHEGRFDERKEEFGLEDVDFLVWPNDEEKREKMEIIQSEARRRWHNVLKMTATLLRRAEKEWNDGNYEAMKEPKNEAFALLSKWFFDLWT